MKLNHFVVVGLVICAGLATLDTRAGSYGKLTPTNGTEASYLVSVTAQTMASSPTDFFEMNGSSSKVVRIQQVVVDLYNESWTYVTVGNIHMFRRSTAASGGTSSSWTPTKLDTNNAASTVGSVKAFTANPTVGTLVGPLFSGYFKMDNLSSNPRFAFRADTPNQAIVLRGTGEYLTLNGGGGFVGTNGGTVKFIVNVLFTESAN